MVSLSQILHWTSELKRIVPVILTTMEQTTPILFVFIYCLFTTDLKQKKIHIQKT